MTIEGPSFIKSILSVTSACYRCDLCGSLRALRPFILFLLMEIHKTGKLLSLMNIGQQILFMVSALGAFNGIVLSLYFFTGRKKRSIPAFFLSLMLLTISLRVAQTVFVFFNPEVPKVYFQTGLVACFLAGPALYHFLLSSLNNIKQVPVSWKWHWAIISGIMLSALILVPHEALCTSTVVSIIYLQWLGYLIASAILLKPVFNTFFTNRTNLSVTEKFRLLVFLGSATIFLVYQLSMLNIMHGIAGICISGAIAFSFFLYLTSFFYFHSARVENLLQVSEAVPAGKIEKRKIADDDAHAWIQKLERLIMDKELYKDPNLKLNDLARNINISGHLLSQLLNENMGKSFSTYINEYRINEACKLITTNDRLTFEAIGYEVGYNSKSTFYAAFKKIKDTTPALFKEGMERMTHK